MKTYILLISILCFGSLQAQQRNAEQLAAHIALRMKDSLGLADEQHKQVAAVNLQIVQNKKLVWAQYAGSQEAIRTNLQRIENGRDSLYKTILTQQQYSAYKEKKNQLLNNN